jgi:hypothetical protein
MADYIFRPYAGGESFNGQIAYPDTTIDIPCDVKRYVDSIDVSESPQYLNKLTGFETIKQKISNSSGSLIETNIKIGLVAKLPDYYYRSFVLLANAINAGGLYLLFYDDICSDFEYTCRWLNTADFVESNVLYGSLSLDLVSFTRVAV